MFQENSSFWISPKAKMMRLCQFWEYSFQIIGWSEFDLILVLERLPQSLVCFPKVARLTMLVTTTILQPTKWPNFLKATHILLKKDMEI